MAFSHSNGSFNIWDTRRKSLPKKFMFLVLVLFQQKNGTGRQGEGGQAGSKASCIIFSSQRSIPREQTFKGPNGESPKRSISEFNTLLWSRFGSC